MDVINELTRTYLQRVVAGVYQRRGLHVTRKHASSNLELSDYLFTHLQQLHRVGAPTGVVHVALGDDHPVSRLDVAPLQKSFYGTLVDVARGQVGGVELDAVHAAHQWYPAECLPVGRQGEDRQMRADAGHDQRGVTAFGQGDHRRYPGEVVRRVHR